MTRQVIPGIRMVTPPQQKGTGWETPNIFLVGDDPLTLIDAGYDRDSSFEPIMEAVGSSRVERIIITHGHVDHAGSAWRVKEAGGGEIVAHQDDLPSMKRRYPDREIDNIISGPQTFPAGEFDIRIIHTPGHTPGHITPMIESEGVFFSADLITGEGSSLVAPPEGNMKKYMASLRMTAQLPLKMILPGHGQVVTDPPKRIAELIEHRELREICIARCLAKGPMDLKLLVKEMYLGLIHPTLEMAAAGTAWAHLEKMIEDGNVIAEPQDEANPFARTFRLSPHVKLPF